MRLAGEARMCGKPCASSKSPERVFVSAMNVILTDYFWAKNRNSTWMPFHLQLVRKFPGNNRLLSLCILTAQGPVL